MNVTEEKQLMEVVDNIDDVLIDLFVRHGLHPSEMIALILARVVAIAKEANGEQQLLVLLDKMKSSIINIPKSDVTLH